MIDYFSSKPILGNLFSHCKWPLLGFICLVTRLIPVVCEHWPSHLHLRFLQNANIRDFSLLQRACREEAGGRNSDRKVFLLWAEPAGTPFHRIHTGSPRFGSCQPCGAERDSWGHLFFSGWEKPLLFTPSDVQIQFSMCYTWKSLESISLEDSNLGLFS